MRTIFLILLLLLYAPQAWGVVLIQTTASASYSCSGFTGDYCQDFNADGEDGIGNAPTNWDDNSGSNTYDNTTPVMEGAQNLYTVNTRNQIYDPNMNDGTIWVSFMFRFDEAIEANMSMFSSINTSAQSAYQYALSLDEKVRCLATLGTSNEGTTILSANTNYYGKIIIDAASGTGACYLWNGSSWDLEASSSGGRTDNIDHIIFSNGSDTESFYYDLIKVDYDSDITSP